jgi:hypothetical protein
MDVQGRCWVEDDNLDAWPEGMTCGMIVPLALVEGKVTARVWPPARMGRLDPTASLAAAKIPSRIVATDAAPPGQANSWW